MEDLSDGEFETALGAAAFAIVLQDEESFLNIERQNEELRSALKAKKDEDMQKADGFSSISSLLRGKEIKEDSNKSADTSLGKHITLEQMMREEQAAEKKPRKTNDATLSIKRTPTIPEIPDKQGQYAPEPLAKQASQQAIEKVKTNNSKLGGTKANRWEKGKMEKITRRYETTKSTILEWEKERKRFVEIARAKKLREYQDEMSRIRKIADGARALAEERRRNDEAKARDLAVKMGSKGSVHNRCCCF